MTPTRTEDLVEIHQLLAKYAVTITQGDVEGLVEVFTPDGTYSAFGDTYTLNRFPVLVDAAPKGLFMTGTALVARAARQNVLGGGKVALERLGERQRHRFGSQRIGQLPSEFQILLIGIGRHCELGEQADRKSVV